MVSYFGLSDKVGNLSFYDSTGQTEYSFTKPYSEQTAELIDKEVSQLVNEQYQRAVNILKEHKEGLAKLAALLLEKEVIFSEDLEKVFGKRKFGKPSVHDDKGKTISSAKPQTKVKSPGPKTSRSAKAARRQESTKKSA